MADEGRRSDAIFFIYDHNMLKREEDDLIDAILYFSPEYVSADDQCALCGQLMGMAEFLTSTLGKSSPRVFKFEHEKFAIKRVGGYSLALQCKRNHPDSVVLQQLDNLYGTFVTFHGSLNSLKLRCKDSNNNFSQGLGNIWRTILEIFGVSMQLNLAKIFHHLPYVQLPKTGSHLFLQASHLLQSNQRRPYVLGGAILYKNEVVCTQLPPTLTRQLTYLREQMPHIEKKMDFDLPVGCKVCTLFLTDEEILHIFTLDPYARRHCKTTDFSTRRDSEVPLGINTKSVPNKPLARRQTCPDISSSLTLYDRGNLENVTKVSDQSSLSDSPGKESFKKNLYTSMAVDRHTTWPKVRSKVSLSHVPIVECRHGESPVDPLSDTLTDTADESYFGKSYRSSTMNQLDTIERLKADIENSDHDSEDDLDLVDSEKDTDDNCKSVSTEMSSDKELCYGQRSNASNTVQSETRTNIINEYKIKTKNGLNFNRNCSETEIGANEILIPQTFQVKVEIHEPKLNTDDDLINMTINDAITNDNNSQSSVPDNSETERFNNSRTELSNHTTDENSSSVIGQAKELEMKYSEKETDDQMKTNIDSTSEIKLKEHSDETEAEEEKIDQVKSQDLDEDRSNNVSDSGNNGLNLCSENNSDSAVLGINKVSNVADIAGSNIEFDKENVCPEKLPSENNECELKTEVLTPKDDTDEPCIGCLDLWSENPESNKLRCSHCLSKKKSQNMNSFHGHKEVIDFSVRGEHQDSQGNQPVDASDTEMISQSMISTETFNSDTLTYSSNVSTDSTVSRFWTHEMDGLNDITLYVQCHSDISLYLLMENPEQYQETLLHSLWKGSLHYLADLDFYIKECLEQDENVPKHHYSFAQFNRFSRDLKANVGDSSSVRKREPFSDSTAASYADVEDSAGKQSGPFNDIVAALHAEFDYHPDLTDLTLRKQANSCYGHRSEVNQTFFQIEGPTRLTSGLPVSKDPNYTLDTVAKAKLAKDKHISFM